MAKQFLSPPKAKLESKGVKSVRLRWSISRAWPPTLHLTSWPRPCARPLLKSMALELEDLDLGLLTGLAEDDQGLVQVHAIDREASDLINPGAMEMRFSPETGFPDWLAFFSKTRPGAARPQGRATQPEAQNVCPAKSKSGSRLMAKVIREQAAIFSDATDGDFIAWLNQKLPGSHGKDDLPEKGLTPPATKILPWTKAGSKSAKT